jgi:RNA polymerase sigma-70 factor (ECF subfamily)
LDSTYPTEDVTSTEDDVLAQAARPGSANRAAAFSQLYRRHFQRVYRYHLAQTGSRADAEDLTAQTFMAALEGIHGYRGEGRFQAWLFGIARRKALMFFRSRKPELALDLLDNLPDGNPLPEVAAGQRLQIEHISRALHSLAPDRAEALALCIFGDLTAQEAGQVMGKTPAAVKMLVYRGLKDLRIRSGLAALEEK